MLATWGANSHGQLGNGNQDDTKIPTQCSPIGERVTIKQIAGGGGHTTVLTSDGRLFACGQNTYGQLGTCSGFCSRTSAIHETPTTTPGSNSSSRGSALAVMDEPAKSARSPAAGELQPAPQVHRSGDAKAAEASIVEWVAVCHPRAPESSVIRHVACGWNHSLACTDTGAVLAWGCNTYGQLGKKTTSKVCTSEGSEGGSGTAGSGSASDPARRHSSCSSGAKCVVPGLPPVKSVSCGLRHSVALATDGHVWTWGHNRRSQLGRGPDGKSLEIPREVAGLHNVISIAAGAYHTLALTGDGGVVCWGYNQHGQCGSVARGEKAVATPTMAILPGDNLAPIQAISAGWSHSVALSATGKVITWGRSNYGQLGRDSDVAAKLFSDEPAAIPDIPSVTQISCGSEHTLALSAEHTVLAWGWNEHGMCGDGTEEDVLVPKTIHVLDGSNRAVLIGCGAGHSLVALDSTDMTS